MAYKINGTNFLIEPTTGRWLPNSPIGITGDGHPIYPAIRQYELRWQLSSQAEVEQLRAWFESTRITGTSSVTLPCYTTGSYSFLQYSGCILFEPERGVFFNGTTTDLTLIVGNIVT